VNGPRTADQLTDEELARIGFAEPARARRFLIGLAGQGVTDDDVAELMPSLLAALAESPDPDRALANFARWADALVSRATHFAYLRSHPTGLRIFVNVGAISQFLADILAHDPEYFEILANPGVRSGAKPADLVYRELAALLDRISQPELKLEAMRRFRQREILRIASRDILGLSDMPTTALEFSNLADACVQCCHELARRQLQARFPDQPVPHLAVIALGKLGGRELNYSSDIDLVFVFGDTAGGEADVEPAARLAELVVANLARDTQNGHLFRVDVRLRPEGRFGALVRTLGSYRSYYENWGETWERQAMLKARVVAGDARTGQAFLDMLVPFAYPRHLTASMLRDMRTNKRRMEQPHLQAPNPSLNVKTGIGGIRDVEFTVQMLQMREGARDPLLRTPNTLQAIARLRQARLFTAPQARQLTDGYIFLRTVEHRLQLLYDRQTQDLPERERDVLLLARRLGYTDSREFQDRYATVTQQVRALHEAVFQAEGAPGTATEADAWSSLLLAADTPQGTAALASRLTEEGFRESERAASVLSSALFGTGHGREAPDATASLRRLAGKLIRACARSGDPDSALHGVSLLAEASPNRAAWYGALDSSDDLLHRLVRLSAGSRTLVQSLARNPEWLDMLVSDETREPEPKALQVMCDELDQRLPKRATADEKAGQAFWDALARYVARERLRIGARDIWGEASASTIAMELSGLAEAVLAATLRWSIETTAAENHVAANEIAGHIAVIGLGKLGGCELSYNSDLDVVFVCSDAVFSEATGAGQRSPLYDLTTAAAERLLASARRLRQRGAPIVIDARLRPEGRFGNVVHSVSQYRDYFADRAATWERQALVKARPIAGATSVQADFMRVAHEAAYGRAFGEREADEIRAMKRRIETERLRPADRTTDIKLGHGGMSDIEFLTQLLQLRHGGANLSLRSVRTIDALDALADAAVIPAPDAARLTSSYRFLSRVRSRLSLLTGQTVDTYPKDARRARALAIGFGTVDTPGRLAEQAFGNALEGRMQETRRIFERHFREPDRPGGRRQ